MKKICVYCGSSRGNSPHFATAADALGVALVERGFDLVYGGADKGLMGVVADAVLRSGGNAYGVLPRLLTEKELAHQGLTELFVVETMHERKGMMAEMADGFVALPGGFGTLEEIAEIVTWGQLHLHEKPCGLLNVDGYFNPLLKYLDAAVDKGFLRAENRRMLLSDSDADGLLTQFQDYAAPTITKWIDGATA